MFILGISGGIGSGKSTVAGLLREAGLAVLDADRISHQVTQADGPALPAIVDSFGTQALLPDGSLDRSYMAQIVFHDHKALDHLSTIIHEQVFQQMDQEIAQLEKAQAQAVVLDVPIPVEKGFLDHCDQVWCVWADEAIRLKRLGDRGMRQEDALRRMQIQMSEDEYRKIADHFILNNGSLDELRDEVQKLMARELGERGIRYLPLT